MLLKQTTALSAIFTTLFLIGAHRLVAQDGADPSAQAVRKAIAKMKIREPNQIAPVSVGAVAVCSGREKDHADDGVKGSLVTLIVRLKIAEGWHVYAHTPADSTFQETKIVIDLPPEAQWKGEWKKPATVAASEPDMTEYRGDAVFTRELYFNTTQASRQCGPGDARITLGGAVRYQVCNNERCLRPRNDSFAAQWFIMDDLIRVNAQD